MQGSAVVHDDGQQVSREMYITPPDTDIFAIPKVLAPMPQKFYSVCAERLQALQCDSHRLMRLETPCTNLREKSRSVFLTKHYRNRQLGDPEFVLEF
ncbi:hypothetical protein CASFOL_000029 [Castilleja foliolosa]|uniref:Uncharacterized protein n=1 Tax=Castilleja foliolosa TaxID=1961234 RepID=A0ABD3EMI7_9LAMI